MWVDQVENIYTNNSWREREREKGRCLPRFPLNTVWQSSTSTSRGSSTLTRPRVSKLLKRSERIKWCILPRSTAVFPLHWKVFQSNHRRTCSGAGGLPSNFHSFTLAWCSVTVDASQNRDKKVKTWCKKKKNVLFFSVIMPLKLSSARHKELKQNPNKCLMEFHNVWRNSRRSPLLAVIVFAPHLSPVCRLKGI